MWSVSKSAFTSRSRRRRNRVEPPAAWSPAQRRLHWSIAALVFAGAALGLRMVAVPFEELLLKFLLYQLHKTIGLTVLGLALAQIVLHHRRGRPAWPPDMPRWQRSAASMTHVALLALLIATPMLGYFTAATAPARIPTLFLGLVPVPHIVGTSRSWFEILRRMHLALALLILALAAVHAGAAINHQLHGRRVLSRMWRG
jgi:cytochrome b561